MKVALVAMLFFIYSREATPASSVGRPQICAADKFANGCSFPLGIEAPYKDEFTPACNKHDICYGCGYHYNWSRSMCDEAFRNDMKTICKTKSKRTRSRRFVEMILDILQFIRSMGETEKRCEIVADVYYEGVRIFADSHFDHKDHDYCTSKCAVMHGGPKTPLLAHKKT